MVEVPIQGCGSLHAGGVRNNHTEGLEFSICVKKLSKRRVLREKVVKMASFA